MANTGKISTATPKATRLREGLLLMMAIPILIITGFQVFWLRENYTKEKKNLELRTNIAFRETIRKLQAKKLNLDRVFNDSMGKIRLEVMSDDPRTALHPHPDEELTNIFNDVTVRVKDTVINIKTRAGDTSGIFIRKNNLPNDQPLPPGPGSGKMVIMTKPFPEERKDSTKEISFEHRGRPEEIFRFLYSVDSLQDSLRISSVDSACRIAFSKEGLTIPFSVSRNDTASFVPEKFPQPGDMKLTNKVTVGVAHPVTYEIILGNSFGYLVKKITSPLLFSLFLVSVTVLSFVLLYRNLLRQRRLAEIKNEFISNITHELKTPIATVGVAIEALRNFNAINDPQRTKEYLDISQNELHRLSLLVDKVLKLSMFEKKEIELKYEPVDLKDIVNEVVSSMKLQIEKNHATVSVNTEGNTSLQADRLHLLSVVFNLLDNALKYGNGNTAVKFELKEKENEVELSVADNGIGISPEYKDKVFEKFFRVPVGNTHNTKGYGLGLSYVAHVIQKHGGTIEVESQQGLGTKFIITLPKQA